MKKLFTQKNPMMVVIVAALLALFVSATVFAAVEILKQSDPIPSGNAYGAYYDNSRSKVKEKEIVVNSKTISVTYVRTENLKNLPVSKRADSYGTYDVYADQNQTEYLFLLNSDIYCGYKMSNVGVATLQENAIEKSKALNIADDFLKKTRSNADEYTLLSCVYDELAGYYDIQYYLSVDGYKSDDIFRLWVDAKGEVTSFSEFNYNRYTEIDIATDKYAKADQKLADVVFKEANKVEFSVVDQYISINDSGDVVLVKVVDLKIPDGEKYIIQREMYVQPIN